jgi:four helix bundle protein
MNAKTTAMQERLKRFAIDIIRFCGRLPKRMEFSVISKQLVRAGTSVGANYRAACRARSRPDFIAKLGIVEEETDETRYWVELLFELGYREDPDLLRLYDEGDQLIAIIVQSKKTARTHA